MTQRVCARVCACGRHRVAISCLCAGRQTRHAPSLRVPVLLRWMKTWWQTKTVTEGRREGWTCSWATATAAHLAARPTVRAHHRVLRSRDINSHSKASLTRMCVGLRASLVQEHLGNG